MGLAIRFSDAEHLVLARPTAVGLLDAVVLVFGWAPPIGVSQHWLSPLPGGLRELMAEGAGGHGASIWSSVTSPKKQAKSVGNGC